MLIDTGARLGPYEITAKLGEGGMGEVWRATDTKLERDVAIKILTPALAADAEALARFEREAKAVAALSHPNILAIFDFGREGEIAYAAMELLEGETLREALAGGALPARKALEIAAQVATGLAAAHERGVVHRDVKPENLYLTREGHVKILDFGLARQGEAAGPTSQLLAAPTLGPRTAAGTVLGTVGYMAPEQVRGEPADARADIFSLGVVLYEMLTGQRAFAHGSAVETMSAILREDPPELEALAERASPEIARLLQRCLEKRPEERFQSARDLAFDLRSLATGSGSGRSQAGGRALAAGRPWRATALRWALGAALVAAGAGLGHVTTRNTGGVPEAPAVSPPPTFRQLTKLPGGEGSPTISPDGETLVYVKRDGGDLDLFSQRVAGTTSIELTAGCDQDDFEPAFSPDGRWIAFRSECDGGGIFVMGATGEARRRVSDFGFAPAWSPDGRELAVVTERLLQPTTRPSTSQLWAVRLDSGERRLVSAHDAMGPTWSPDGHRIAFWGLKGNTFQRDLWSVAADGSQSAPETAVPILDDPPLDWAPVYSRDGRWLYFSSARGGTYNLWRFALDPATGAPVGAPEPVTAPSSSAGPFALSADGRRLVYVDFNMRSEILRAPVDPSRRALAAPPVPVFSGSFEQREQNLSPAGDWIVFTNEDPPQQLHLVRSDGTGYRQLTTDGDRHRQAEFSPDGAWIVFQTTRGGAGLAAIRTDGGGWQTVTSARGLSIPRWSPDGSTIAAFGNDTGAVLFDVRGGLSAAPSRDLPPVAEGVLFWPQAWSPDGALLAGFGNREGQNTSLVVRSTTSGEYRTVAPLATGAGFGWLTFLDRRLLAYASNQAVSLYDLDAAGAPTLFYAPRPGRDLTSLAASRDGRWLTWIERADESDIWLMTFGGGAAGPPQSPSP